MTNALPAAQWGVRVVNIAPAHGDDYAQGLIGMAVNTA